MSQGPKMAGDAGVEVAQLYVLDLAVTQLHTWRLRREPRMDAEEIDVFYHGDRIRAARNSAHPLWLELVDRPGWVKQYHEGLAVWHVSEPEGKSSPCRSEMNQTHETSSTKKCFEDDDMPVSKSVASCSGSSSNSPMDRQLPCELRPASFAGKGHKLGDGGRKLGDSGALWFTGQSYRIAEVQSEALFTETKEKPKWADIVDSDPEDANPVLTVDNSEDMYLEKAPEISPTMELVRNRRVIGDSDQEYIDPVHKVDIFEDMYLEKVLAISPKTDPVRNRRRRKRNQDLLLRKSKTQFCRYLQEKGACPFGDACWFAHTTENLDLDVQKQDRPPAPEDGQ